MKVKVQSKKFAGKLTDMLRRKILSLVSNQFRYECADLYAKMIEPYVPKDTGRLRRSYTIPSSGKYIKYNTDYAQKVYEIPARHYTTEGTTHHWDVYANPIIMDEYMAAVNSLAKEYMSRIK